MTDGLPTFRHTTFSMHVWHVSSNYKPIFLGAWANFWRSAVFYSIFWLILKCKSGAAHFRRYSHLSKTSQWIWISVWFYIMETPVSNRFNLQFLKLSHVFITWCLKYWFRFAWEQEGFRTSSICCPQPIFVFVAPLSCPTAFFGLKVTRSLVTRLGSWDKPSTQWSLNLQPSNSNVKSWSTHRKSTICTKVDNNHCKCEAKKKPSSYFN